MMIVVAPACRGDGRRPEWLCYHVKIDGRFCILSPEMVLKGVVDVKSCRPILSSLVFMIRCLHDLLSMIVMIVVVLSHGL